MAARVRIQSGWSRCGVSGLFVFVLALVTMCPAALAASAKPVVPNVEDSVVKVFSTLRSPDPFRPWSKQAPREVTGSGVIIEGKRILTNAHVVLYAGQIQVQANQAGDKIAATVVAIAPGIDLAVLQLDDESFFDKRPPVPRANLLPEIKDNVLAYGFPSGGTSLSITKGIVSRIEFVQYNFPVSGLRIQIDAAINPGNSGGPTLAGDKMVGLAFAGMGNAQSIGYIIPNEEIELFLQDIRDGEYGGKLSMFDDLQPLENAALRASLKLDKSVEGVVVRRPYKDADYPLKEWDVITRIGDMPIDNQGMSKLGNLRVNFRYRIQQVAKNGKLPLTVLRDGKLLPVQLDVAVERPLLIPDLKGGYPSYFIYGPVVFSKATNEFLSFLSTNPANMSAYAFNGSPLVTRRGDAPDGDLDELVVVAAPFFPHKLVNGYSSRYGSVVYSVNDVAVRSLSHLVGLLRDLKDEFVVIRFEQRGGETVVLSREATLAATEEILTDNGVRNQGSPDMMAIWERKAVAPGSSSD